MYIYIETIIYRIGFRREKRNEMENEEEQAQKMCVACLARTHDERSDRSNP